MEPNQNTDPEMEQFEADLLESVRQAKRGEVARVHYVSENANDASATDSEPDDSFTLRIYRVPSGQWVGVLIDSVGQEFGPSVGCDSPQEVERQARESGIYPDRIEIEAS